MRFNFVKQLKNCLLAAAAVVMACQGSQATADVISMSNWAGNGASFMFNLDRNNPVTSVTGTADASGLGAGFLLEITATSLLDNGTGAVPSNLGETNGGFTVAQSHVNRWRDNSTIVFDMKIKDALDVDVTSDYQFTITDLEAFVDGNQTALSILVDGTTEYEFHKGTAGNTRIFASNAVVPSYDVPDPSNVTFNAVGNPGAAFRFNFSGMNVTVVPSAIPEPSTFAFGLLGLVGLVARRRRRA